MLWLSHQARPSDAQGHTRQRVASSGCLRARAMTTAVPKNAHQNILKQFNYYYFKCEQLLLNFGVSLSPKYAKFFSSWELWYKSDSTSSQFLLLYFTKTESTQTWLQCIGNGRKCCLQVLWMSGWSMDPRVLAGEPHRQCSRPAEEPCQTHVLGAGSWHAASKPLLGFMRP